jgi:hypothetical protein
MNISFGRIAHAAVAACVVAAASGGTAAAFGALAVGEPPNISKQGLATGNGYNYSTKEGAEARALKECLTFKGAPPATRGLCKVVITFEKQCFAIAMDPKAGTPGFGWSVMKEKAEAETSAMNQCRKTAGSARVKFCEVADSKCDENDSSSPPQ